MKESTKKILKVVLRIITFGISYLTERKEKKDAQEK